MALIKFVNNHDDLSTDRGYQFRFYCDKCGDGHMSRFQPSVIGTAGSLLRAASSLFGGWASSAGNSAYEVQQAIGGKAHDDALEAAVQEGKQHFQHCSRCGKWVCPDVCWNHASGQCEECAPDFTEEMASSHAHAKAAAAREQLYEKARQTDYVAAVDMKSASVSSNKSAGVCSTCGAAVTGKFCPDCGSPARKPIVCTGCGHHPERPVKFCPECGGQCS
jgi:hypothetical protein